MDGYTEANHKIEILQQVQETVATGQSEQSPKVQVWALWRTGKPSATFNLLAVLSQAVSECPLDGYTEANHKTEILQQAQETVATGQSEQSTEVQVGTLLGHI